MRVLDLFAGTGSASGIWLNEGHDVVRVEIEERFSDLEGMQIMSVLDIDKKWVDENGPFDIVWASPPCTYISRARQIVEISFNWNPDRPWIEPKPLNQGAIDSIELVNHTLKIIEWASPKWYFIENPATGHLPRFDFMKRLMRHDITYDKYGKEYLKPTAIMGRFPWTWQPRAPTSHLKNSNPNFEEMFGNDSKSSRKWNRSQIPFELVAEIFQACECYTERPYPWFS